MPRTSFNFDVSGDGVPPILIVAGVLMLVLSIPASYINEFSTFLLIGLILIFVGVVAYLVSEFGGK